MMLVTSQSKQRSASSGICELQHCQCLHLVLQDIKNANQKKYAHLDFQLEIAIGLIAGFSSRKRREEVPLHIGPVTAANENNH